MYNFVKLKPLDEHAKVHYARYQAGVPVDVFMGIILKTPLYNGDDEIAHNILVKAAQYLLSQDRMLSAIPLEDGEEIFWAGITSKLDVESLVSIDHCSKSFNNTSSRIEYIYNHYLSQHLTFDGNPIWKIVLNRGHNGEKDVLMVVVSHVLADGDSARRLIVKILDFIQSDKEKEYIPINTDGTFPIQHSTTPSLALEDVFTMRVPLLKKLQVKLLSYIWSKHFPNWLYKIFLCKNKLYYSRDNERLRNVDPSLGVGIRVIMIPSLYSAIKSPMLTYSLSVNSVLSRLVDFAIFETSEHFKNLSKTGNNNTARDNKSIIYFRSNTAVKIDSPNNSTVENFPGAFEYCGFFGFQNSFWKSVENYHHSVHNTHRSDARFTAHLFIHHAGCIHQFIQKCFLYSHNVFHRIGVTYMSNIGTLHNTRDNNTGIGLSILKYFNISNAFFFTTCTPFLFPTGAFAVNVDKTSETTLSFSWRKDCISDEWIDYFETVLQKSANKIVAKADSPDLNMTFQDLVSSLP